ncbi:MAG: hypothetical protein EP330_12780 [Deltaproteobacteria bacterium]|nr:MAG: hypothetical protein EP330_12780 [Deltaproteobacteria bacterium]
MAPAQGEDEAHTVRLQDLGYAAATVHRTLLIYLRGSKFVRCRVQPGSSEAHKCSATRACAYCTASSTSGKDNTSPTYTVRLCPCRPSRRSKKPACIAALSTWGK